MDNITVTWRCKNCGVANDSESCSCESCGEDRTTGGDGKSLRSALLNQGVIFNQPHGVIFNQPNITVNVPKEPKKLKDKDSGWSPFINGMKISFMWIFFGIIIGAAYGGNIPRHDKAEVFASMIIWGIMGGCISSCLCFLKMHVVELWKMNAGAGFAALASLLITGAITLTWFLTSPAVAENVIAKGPLVIAFVALMLMFAYCTVSFILILIIYFSFKSKE